MQPHSPRSTPLPAPRGGRAGQLPPGWPATLLEFALIIGVAAMLGMNAVVLFVIAGVLP